jgi:4a-hydroxytetrahydrobiopterin dehydratase
MADLLSADEVETGIAELDGWAGDSTGIMRTVELASFPAAIGMVNRVAEVAEEMDHHPDINIRWRTLTFICATHSEGGVTKKDLELASRIDSLVAAAQ